jgi:hypothetical protein
MGLSAVVLKTSPMLNAMLPLQFCDHAVDAPAIGIEATKARPTNIC